MCGSSSQSKDSLGRYAYCLGNRVQMDIKDKLASFSDLSLRKENIHRLIDHGQ